MPSVLRKVACLLYMTIEQLPPFRAEHVGSYLRPPHLLDKRNDFAGNKCSAEELRAAEDEAIKHVVQLQRDAGIKSITDGELRRYAFFDGVFEKLGGMVPEENFPLAETNTFIPYLSIMMKMGMQTMPTLICKGEIKRTQGFYTEDFKYLKSLLKPEEVPFAKVTMCPPEWLHVRHGSERTYDMSVYSSDTEYFAAVSRVYREEIQELYGLGCRNLQLDCPTLAFFCSDEVEKGFADMNIDANHVLDKYITLLNDCLKDKPADMSVGVHLCRGNLKGMAFFSGAYDRIAQKLFGDLNVDCYYLEYDNERAGTFDVLKYLPLNKKVVLGIFTTKSGKLECLDEMTKRIYEAVDVLCKGESTRSREAALSQICVSPQCGFASQYEGNPINEEDEKRKLALVTELAKRIWH